jgi:aminoglycoside 3-N-acetyltransferase
MTNNNWLFFKVKVAQVLPRIFLNMVKKIVKPPLIQQYKSKKKIGIIKGKKSVNARELKDHLTKLGLEKGMKVMVHSSLPGIGYVDGGAHTVINVLLEIIGSEGLLIMPCPPTSGSTVEALEQKEVFDPYTTPCTTGIICETFRKWPGVVRSYHPTHSVAAYGKDAKWMVKDHHLDNTPFGPDSPFARLLELDGVILGIGLDTRWITFYHHFEDIHEHFPINIYSREKYKIPVIEENGTQIIVTTSHHDSIVSSVRLNNDSATLKAIDNALTNYGMIKRSTIGRSRGYLVKASNIIHTLDYILKTNNQTIYNMDLLEKLKPEAIKSNSI